MIICDRLQYQHLFSVGIHGQRETQNWLRCLYLKIIRLIDVAAWWWLFQTLSGWESIFQKMPLVTITISNEGSKQNKGDWFIKRIADDLLINNLVFIVSHFWRISLNWSLQSLWNWTEYTGYIVIFLFIYTNTLVPSYWILFVKPNTDSYWFRKAIWTTLLSCGEMFHLVGKTD